jgi:hypothetical protein
MVKGAQRKMRTTLKDLCAPAFTRPDRGPARSLVGRRFSAASDTPSAHIKLLSAMALPVAGWTFPERPGHGSVWP